jgi:16S rRNA (cytosine1402-N4)-methyltransferase
MIYKNADGKFARRIAKAIIEHRPIDSTLQLVDIVRSALPAAVVRKKHPGKQVFQAIRMVVNDELGAIASVIQQAKNLLKTNGTLAIITFHSIEDRFVKLHFKELVAKDTGNIPIMIKPEFIAKQVRPTSTEISNNRRSKSSKLRVLRKV